MLYYKSHVWMNSLGSTRELKLHNCSCERTFRELRFIDFWKKRRFLVSIIRVGGGEKIIYDRWFSNITFCFEPSGIKLALKMHLRKANLKKIKLCCPQVGNLKFWVGRSIILFFIFIYFYFYKFQTFKTDSILYRSWV